eukprot:COSAG05_NODE_2897_length_2529_cov_1.666667_5_plen_156_part_00
MVLGLERLTHTEDSKLVAGHVALLFEDYATAQDFFLASSRPITALEMRRDLLHWEQSLKLARTLAPAQIPYISRAYGQQLEFKGEYSLALQQFEKGTIDERQACIPPGHALSHSSPLACSCIGALSADIARIPGGGGADDERLGGGPHSGCGYGL